MTRPEPRCPPPKALPGCTTEKAGWQYVARNYRVWPVCPKHGCDLAVTRGGGPHAASLGCPKAELTYIAPAWTASVLAQPNYNPLQYGPQTCSQCSGAGYVQNGTYFPSLCAACGGAGLTPTP
jgi:hypothetical protein